MIRSIRESQIDVGHEANHEVLFIDHRPNCLRSRALPGNKWRRSGAAVRRRLLTRLVVRTRPWMIWRHKRRILWMNAEQTGSAQHRMVPHAAENLVRLGLIVVDTISVAPAMRGEVERHHEVFLTNGSGAG